MSCRETDDDCGRRTPTYQGGEVGGSPGGLLEERRGETLGDGLEGSLGESLGSLGAGLEWEEEWAKDSLHLVLREELPWTGHELDLEQELARRRSLSSSSSVDLVRQPPSGRSSSSSSSTGVPPRTLDLSSTRKTLSSCPSPLLPSPYSRLHASPSSSCSEESGFQGSEVLDSSFTSSMNSSSIFTSSINLSPVKEAREPGYSTPDCTLSPSSPTVFGEVSTTDTVIKVTLETQLRPRNNPALARGLFGSEI